MKYLLAEKIDFDKLQNAVPGLDQKFKWDPRASGAEKIGLLFSIILPYVFIIAGLLLLFFLIAGGFQLMTSANNEKGVEAAKAKITNAVVGFLLLFVSFWIVQIIEFILGFQVL